jgi:uncharacterized protein YbjQ (UPF0145 family)
MAVHSQWVTTGLGFEGQRIVGYRGVVRGITVRSRNLIVNFGAAIQALFGGNISLYTALCERARQEAFDLNEVGAGVTEVLAYGTAVVIESDR